ncbi:MAG: hypothetical protein WKF70_00815 [Chitinophagaceae bacterium]
MGNRIIQTSLGTYNKLVDAMGGYDQSERLYLLDDPSSTYRAGRMSGINFCAFKEFSNSTEALCCVFAGDTVLHANIPFFVYFNLNHLDFMRGQITLPGQVATLLHSDEQKEVQKLSIGSGNDHSSSANKEQEFLLLRRFRVESTEGQQTYGVIGVDRTGEYSARRDYFLNMIKAPPPVDPIEHGIWEYDLGTKIFL